MRKILTFLLIFTGTVFSVFIFNIVMYAMAPDYRHAISSAVASTQEIPVITPDMVKESTGVAKTNTEVASYLKTTILEDEEVALAASSPASKNPIVIDKEYHEDCGTGKGYWVITYSDGNVVIEE